MDWLENLNDSQKEAVLHTEGPLMIIAGAGSGKTTVLTARIAYILHQKLADPYEILALTFTNKAAKEMKERIEKRVGPEARGLWMGTFHSIFARILRTEADFLGYTNTFTIYDMEDSQALIKTIVKELKISDERAKPNAIAARISSAKNMLVDAKEYADRYAADEFCEMVAKVYQIYEKRCKQANAMDFDDLLVKPVELFQKKPEALQKLQKRFKYIMVDEYQDTNFAQYMITKMLAAGSKNIAVVGDDAQSIYAFRGANIQNILNFQKDYPDAKVVKLELNYRSSSTIVEAANSVISHNHKQLEKSCYTINPEGEKIHLFEAENEHKEARLVIDKIQELKLTKHLKNKEIAILYRTNAQSRVLEDELIRQRIPYRIYGGLSFYKRKEIKDVLAYLRLAINPSDEEAIKRVINYPTRGIGDSSVERLLSLANQTNMTLWEVITKIKSLDNSRSAAPVFGFGQLIQMFIAYAKHEDASKSVEYIAKHSGILKNLMDENTQESRQRWENVHELLNAAKYFVENPLNADLSLEAFIADIALMTDADKSTENDDTVSMMTIHSAKGLEFDAVFVTGLEEGLFPSNMSLNSRQDLEEERRLFYVAMTRARLSLCVSYAKTRLKFGRTQEAESSRFINEIDSKHLSMNTIPKSFGTTYTKTNTNTNTNQTFTTRKLVKINPTNNKQAEGFESVQLKNLQKGTKVEHPKFGLGEIVGIDGKGEDAKATVLFETEGQKVLLLKYAKLKILG